MEIGGLWMVGNAFGQEGATLGWGDVRVAVNT